MFVSCSQPRVQLDYVGVDDREPWRRSTMWLVLSTFSNLATTRISVMATRRLSISAAYIRRRVYVTQTDSRSRIHTTKSRSRFILQLTHYAAHVLLVNPIIPQNLPHSPRRNKGNPSFSYSGSWARSLRKPTSRLFQSETRFLVEPALGREMRSNRRKCAGSLFPICCC